MGVMKRMVGGASGYVGGMEMERSQQPSIRVCCENKVMERMCLFVWVWKRSEVCVPS